MDWLRRLTTTIWFAFRRLRATWAITIASILALGSLVGVWTALPLYAESASARLLAVEVDDSASDGVPFGYLFSYNRLSGGNQSWQDFEPLNSLLAGPEAPFGSNVTSQQQVFSTIPFDLLESTTGEPNVLDSASFAALSSFESLANLTEGRYGEPAQPGADSVEVVVDRPYAEELGVSIGQRLTVLNRRVDLDDPRRTIDIVIVGIWDPPAVVEDERPNPSTRFLRTGTLASTLIVPTATIVDAIDPLSDATMTNAQWLVLLDSSQVTTDSVAELLASTDRISRQVDDRLRGARVLVSPESSLENFQDDVARLNRGLSLFSLPTIALALAVSFLIVTMRWAGQRRDILLLRRRGVRSMTLIGQTVFEAVLLAIAAGITGFATAHVIARFMGRTTTFLQLSSNIDLDLVMNSRSWRALIIATVVAAAMVVAPSFTLVRGDGLPETRGSRSWRPWWQRTGLDLMVVVVIMLFTWFVLRRDVLTADLLEDPLVILLPALNALAAGLLTVRVLPWVSGRIADVLDRSDRTAVLFVARRFERRPRAMMAPLLLLVITAGLAVYTGSLARTLDLQLFDTAYHLTGAPSSVRSGTDQQLGSQFGISEGRSLPAEQSGPPIDPASFSRIWGIENASRVASMSGRLEPPSGPRVPITFTGIDTGTFANVAFWRDDYATLSLPALIARLEATPDALLVPESVSRRAGLQLGDRVTISVRTSSQTIETEMVIVGTFTQFPTWVPGADDLPPVVGSLSDFEARSPSSVARSLLFKDTESTDLAQTRADLNRLGVSTDSPQRAEDIVQRIQERPQRQGVFGLLTVSFAVSGALAIAGFIFYAVFGFTRQLTELGVLRALGMPGASLTAIVTVDLLAVASTGVGVGALTGLAMARWYLPSLIDNPLGSAPTTLQEIDWAAAIGIPAVLAVVLVAITAALLIVLRRLRLFQAVKVGSDL